MFDGPQRRLKELTFENRCIWQSLVDSRPYRVSELAVEVECGKAGAVR